MPRRLSAIPAASACLAVFLSAVSSRVNAQPSPPAAPAQTPTRSCAANPVLVPGAKQKTRKSKHPLPPEPVPACLEIKGQAIEVQEFLQSYAREQQWRTGENHASEDTWSFVRYLNSEELEKFADTNVLIESVKFSSGKAAVVVRTSDAGEGYVRVQVSARFQGEGKSQDQVMAQPVNSWPLASRGAFEQELLTALQSRYKPVS